MAGMNMAMRMGMSAPIGSPAFGSGGGGAARWMATNKGASMMAVQFSSGANQYQINRIPGLLPVSFRYFKYYIPLVYNSTGSFTASMDTATSVMTVTAWTAGKIEPGDIIGGGTVANTQVVAQLTNTNGAGITGREGTYSISIAQTVASRTMTHQSKDLWYDRVMKFQKALKRTFTHAQTGLPLPDVLVKFSGADYLAYDPATWDKNIRGVWSDLADAGGIIPANQEFEKRTVLLTAATEFPTTASRSSVNNPLSGRATSASDLVATNDIMTRTTFTAHASGGGDNIFFDNSFLVVQTSDAATTIMSLGDSTLFANATDYGDDYGECGVIGRGLARRSFMHCNFGRGADGDFNLVDAAKWPHRRQVMADIHAVAPFQEAIHAHGINDCSKLPANVNLVASSQYRYGDTRIVGTRSYICVAPADGSYGTSSATLPTHTSGVAVDGGVSWLCWNVSSTATVQRAAILAGNTANTLRLLRTVIGAIPLFGWKITPVATSANGFIAPDDQAPALGWGNSASLRGIVNADRVANNATIFNFAGVIDANTLLEAGADTSHWVLGATANLYTQDGTHHLTAGAILGAPSLDSVPLAP